MSTSLRASLRCACMAIVAAAGNAPVADVYAVTTAVTVKDDAQHQVTLASPARRIVSLAPHATELLFAAGAGAAVVGVSEFSNYPAAAARLPSVGGTSSLDVERVVTLKPDLVIAWNSGNSAAQVAKLRKLQIPVFESEPRSFEDIASNLERLAHLAGTDSAGQSAAAAFRQRIRKLEESYRQRPMVRVFYQIWQEPLMTLNDRHLIGAALRLCGGKNVFGDLPQLAPIVSTEAVVQQNPEVIFATRKTKAASQADWGRFPRLTAVANDNLYSIDPDLMSRSGPRFLDGTEMLCNHLEAARAKRRN